VDLVTILKMPMNAKNSGKFKIAHSAHSNFEIYGVVENIIEFLVIGRNLG